MVKLLKYFCEYASRPSAARNSWRASMLFDPKWYTSWILFIGEVIFSNRDVIPHNLWETNLYFGVNYILIELIKEENVEGFC